MKQKINKFLGYTTKPDDIVGEPGLAIVAENCFIHQGDIVNLPAFIKFDKIIPSVDRRSVFIPMGIYKDSEEYLAVRVKNNHVGNTKGYSILLFRSRSDIILHGPIVIQSKFDLVHDHEFFFRNQIKQIGDFGYILGDSGINALWDPDWEDHGLPQRNLIPQMLKFVSHIDPNITGGEPVSDIYTGDVVGIHAPYFTTVVSNTGSGGFLSGRYEFALSIVHPIERMPLDRKTSGSTGVGGLSSFMSPLNGESNITSVFSGERDLQLSNSRYITFELSYHPGIIESMFNTINGIVVGIYARKSTESQFEFIDFWDTGGRGTTGPNDTINQYEPAGGESTFSNPAFDFTSKYGLSANNKGLWSWRFTVDLNTGSFNTSKIPPIAGAFGPTIGSHDVPNPSFHTEWFKQRLYYANIGTNLLQISAPTPNGIEETGTYTQYIEDQEPIGNANEDITGIIRFLGRLVIFKEREMWVLTDAKDNGGELKLLFSDIGCTNINSRSYIVYNEVLYWIYNSKVYRYDGEGRPVVISEIIEEDLRALDTSRIFISVNERYGLIYFSEVPEIDYTTSNRSLIYNHNNGTWTKTVLSFNNIAKVSDYQFAINNFNFYQLKGIEDTGSKINILNEELSGFYTVNWQSSELDFNESGRDKWWKYIITILEELAGIATNDNLIAIRDGREVLAFGKKELLKIGRHSKRITIALERAPDNDTLHPFRIREFQLEATIKGRR